MNHSYGCCLIARCRNRVLNSKDRSNSPAKGNAAKKRCEAASHSKALRAKSIGAPITFRASFGSARASSRRFHHRGTEMKLTLKQCTVRPWRLDDAESV